MLVDLNQKKSQNFLKNIKFHYDYIIIGTGPAGTVILEMCASPFLLNSFIVALQISRDNISLLHFFSLLSFFVEFPLCSFCNLFSFSFWLLPLT